MFPVVILAGGLGTRVASVTGGSLPKVLLPVGDRPFIDVKLAGLAAQGAEDVVLLVAHGAEQVRAHVGDGASLGLRVHCVEDPGGPLGTGGAVRAALAHLPDTFWVTYGDTFLRAPMAEIERCFVASRRLGLMTVLHNRDELETSNVDINGSLVTAYDKACPPGNHEYIDYGLLLLGREAFSPHPAGEAFDLGDLIRDLVRRRQLLAFPVSERFYHVGTPEALSEAAAFLRRERVWERLSEERRSERGGGA